MQVLQTKDGLDVIIPMKASGTDATKLDAAISSPNWTCDLKLDGHYFSAYINTKEDFSTRMFSRHVSRETGVFTERTENLRDLVSFAKGAFKNYGPMIMPGELVHYKGKDTVTSVCGGHVESSWKRQEELGRPVFCPFDLIMLDGTWLGNLPLSKRKLLLKKICKDVGISTLMDQEDFKDVTNKKLWQLTPTLDLLQAELGEKFSKKDMWNYALEHGFEGLVHKCLDSIYETGYISNDKVRVRSSKNWIKQKKKREFDVIILGFTDAKFGVTGQFDGLIGAIVFGQYVDGILTEIGQASGMDVATRRDMTCHDETYIGMVATIEAQERSSARNRLRHAQFKRLRTDKRQEECIYDENET